ncbi:MAG: hypothetical protein HY392_04810 [Candidatus Diapherotrites archaeon]|nr:hypothetical protein [Candidatus Diapherotrites archaeon]
MKPGKKRGPAKRAVSYAVSRYRLASQKARAWIEETARARELEKTLFLSAGLPFSVYGKQVTILKAGFANPFQIKDQNRIRPVVFVLVKNTPLSRRKIVLFYRSTGRQSGMPGAWLPAKSIAERITLNDVESRVKVTPDKPAKFAGQPSARKRRPANFQAWVNETSGKIKRLEENNLLRLHDDWDMSTYRAIMRRVFRSTKMLEDMDVENTVKKK